mmetsp:Transcript_12140/g.16952  ORF Transcript_12140/g.16952 Transcript_12140/m.16952 type:complete len:201 (+) Transcript_12140:195-797(+)
MNDHIIEMNNRSLRLLEDQRFAEAVMAFKDTFTHAVAQSQRRMVVRSHPTSKILKFTQEFMPENLKPFYIFSRGLVLTGTPSIQAELPSAILYNLALSIHLHSIQIGERGIPLKRKAMHLYQQTLSLMPNSIFELAALHNMALILHDLADYQGSQRLFTRMKIFAEVRAHDMRKCCIGNDFQEMFVNVHYLKEPQLSSAA